MARPNLDSVPGHLKDQALEVLLFTMGQEIRGRLMRECPVAYNALMGKEYVRVVSVDGQSIGKLL